MNSDDERAVGQIVGELTSLRWDGRPLDLDVFGNRVSSGQYTMVYRAALEYLPRGSDVLDWGCGNGHFSYFLTRMGFRATGFSFLDRPPLMEELEGQFRFVRGSENEPSALPFAPETFDAVVSMGVLEHVRETGGNEGASLREIMRILKPGGVFLCAHFPNRHSWIEFLTRNFFPAKFHHRFRFTPRDIAALWGSAGFDVRLVRRYGWLPRNFASGLRSPVMNSRPALAAYGLFESVAKVVLYPFHQNFLIVALKS